MTASINLGGKIPARLARFGRDQSGSAALTYVTMLPLVFGVFLMTLDSGFATMRAATLDRAVDLTARSIRNGTLPAPTLTEIRTEICARLTFDNNCLTTLKVQILPVQRSNFTMPARTLACADSGAKLTPVLSFAASQQNPIAVLRACREVESVTPLTLVSNSPGAYVIHAETVIAGTAS